jgi:hypothetical protein
MERAWIPKELVLVASRAITQSWPLMTSGSRTVLPATFACGIVLGAIGMLLVSERARTSSADPASSPARLGALSSQGEGPSQGEGRFTAANPPPRTDDSVARVSSGSAVVSKATPTSNQRMQPAAPDSDDDARTPTARPVVYRGSLRLDSQPRGARVFLNGREMGTTPLDLTNLAVGSRAVRLELDGYQLWSSSVQVSTSRRSSVTATLSPEVEQPASVRLGVEGLDGRPAVRPLLNMSVP